MKVIDLDNLPCNLVSLLNADQGSGMTKEVAIQIRTDRIDGGTP